MQTRTLRCWEFNPSQAARFADYLATRNQAILFELYDEQQRGDEMRAAQVCEGFKNGVKTPDTLFNRRALEAAGLLP